MNLIINGRKRAWERLRQRVWVRVRERECEYVSVCVWEREWENERMRENKIERSTGGRKR